MRRACAPSIWRSNMAKWEKEREGEWWGRSHPSNHMRWQKPLRERGLLLELPCKGGRAHCSLPPSIALLCRLVPIWASCRLPFAAIFWCLSFRVLTSCAAHTWTAPLLLRRFLWKKKKASSLEVSTNPCMREWAFFFSITLGRVYTHLSLNPSLI